MASCALMLCGQGLDEEGLERANEVKAAHEKTTRKQRGAAGYPRKDQVTVNGFERERAC